MQPPGVLSEVRNKTWDILPFWRSLAWDIAREKLNALDREKRPYNPNRLYLFRALDLCEREHTRVCIIGQDPYPDPRLATGVAFSIPDTLVCFPPTLETLFKEYEDDLHLPRPSNGDLTQWCSRGVLLWNAFPTCLAFKSLSHTWDEWRELTTQIVTSLCEQNIVFVLLGGRARAFADVINWWEFENMREGENIVIELCHPSPRANTAAKTEAKFSGSRIFTRVNEALVSLGYDPIKWELTNAPRETHENIFFT